MSLTVVGLNHTTAPVETREAVALSDEEASFATDVGKRFFHEQICISTCNRTEFYTVAKGDPTETPAIVRRLLEEVKGVTGQVDGRFLYVYQGEPAMEHLMRVASGLDSLMVGERQILGQIKHAYQIAVDAGAAGTVLNRLFQASLHAGKRAQTETAIGVGAVSVSYASIGLAERVFGDLSSRRALVVGIGDAGALAAKHLSDAGFRHLSIANRTYNRAKSVAENLGAYAVEYETLPEELELADVVVCTTSASEPIIDYQMVREAMRNRPDRLMVIVDIAVPRDVDPKVNKLDNVLLHDMDALEVVVSQNLARREKEIPKVESIIREVRDEFQGWQDSLAVTPIIKAMRSQIEAIRQQEVEKYARKAQNLEKDDLDAVTRSVVNKILHMPTAKIKEFSGDKALAPGRLDTVRELFGLWSDLKDKGNPEYGDHE
ncbi:MAG: glutamyl-tRNA reductase [Candidatus Latescibacteria bacterium]|nr:glutamyl-tRNA reductase [Candidatus Latescibacterota bacterium]